MADLSRHEAVPVNPVKAVGLMLISLTLTVMASVMCIGSMMMVGYITFEAWMLFTSSVAVGVGTGGLIFLIEE